MSKPTPPRSTPKSLIPALSTSLNVGMALGAWITVLPFANPAYPGPAVAVWFRDFFKPGFIGITSLSAVTIASGIRAAWILRGQGQQQQQQQAGSSSSAEGRDKAKKASRWAIAGLVFTLIHFGFGNSVSFCLFNLFVYEISVRRIVGLILGFQSRCSPSWTRSCPRRIWRRAKWRAGSSCTPSGR